MPSYIYWLIDLVLLIAIVMMFVYPKWSMSRNAKLIDNEEFERLMPTAQLIDIREAGQFRTKHILGARNIMASQMDVSLNAISKQKPVLLYENGRPQQAGRIAKQLKKAGVTEIYILKDGLSKWTGKTKTDL